MKGAFLIHRESGQRIYLTREQMDFDRAQGADYAEWEFEDDHADERDYYEDMREEARQEDLKYSRL